MNFDPGSAFTKVRTMKGVRFHQNGHEFTSGHKDMGKILKNGERNMKVPDEKKLKAKKDAREQANRPLDGFKPAEATGQIAEALKENREAAAAEAHAE